MCPAKPPQLSALDVRVLVPLRQDEGLERSGRYEWLTLDRLAPVERLMNDLAEGPALELCLQDEFVQSSLSIPDFPPRYTLNKKGRLWRLYSALENLEEVLKAIPFTHLSPRVQAFERVFFKPDFLISSSTKPSTVMSYHRSVAQAVADVRRLEVTRPGQPLNPHLWIDSKREWFNLEDASSLLGCTNDYLRFLTRVLKHADVKRAQRTRKVQAENHYKTFKELIEKTLKETSPVRQVYIELEAPILKEHDFLSEGEGLNTESLEERSYRKLNEARKSFLKSRNHNPLFHGLISYVWAYRYSYGRGLTCIMILFYDANRESQLYSLTHALGAYWKSIAGEGSHYSSPVNNTNEKYSEQYFGLIDADNPYAIKGLETLVRFISLYQLYLKPAAPKHMHTFETSKMPGVNKSKRIKRRKKKVQKEESKADETKS